MKLLQYRGVPIDYAIMGNDDWEDGLRLGATTMFLTHTVPIYDRSGSFARSQKRALKDYRSEEFIARERERVKGILEARSKAGLESIERGHLCEAALALESCFYEVGNLLVRRHKGFPSTSLVFSEVARIGAALGKDDWSRRAMNCLRFNLSRKRYLQLLDVYGDLFQAMRGKLNRHDAIVRRLRRMKLGVFSAGASDLVLLCSETVYRQLCDKIGRALTERKKADAGLTMQYLSQYNFFMFSPFFYLKNVNPKASGKTIATTPFHKMLACWDNDIRAAWKAVARFDILSPKTLRNLDKLNHEIFSFCS